jgi:hypothetical protein
MIKIFYGKAEPFRTEGGKAATRASTPEKHQAFLAVLEI